MAEWAAARRVAARIGAAADGRAARLDRPHSPADAETTETPSHWRRSVRNFSNWLLRSLADAGGALAELAAIGLTSSGGDPSG